MWGGAVSAVKFALGGFDALTLLTIELLAATTVLWAALIAGGYRPPRSWTVAVVLGLLEPGLSYLLEAIGLTRTGARLGPVPAHGRGQHAPAKRGVRPIAR